MSLPASPVVAMTVSGARPDYLAEVLESWRAAREIGAWRFVFGIEPGERVAECVSEVERFAASGRAAAVYHAVYPKIKGVTANPHAVLSWAFSLHAPFAVLAEEDAVVSSDVLEFFGWAAGALSSPLFAVRAPVLAVCAFSRLDPARVPAEPGEVRCGPFSPLVWGTWPDRWAELSPRWFDAAAGDEKTTGYDFGMERMAASLSMPFAHPVASRSDHIGREGGVHCHDDEVFDASRAPSFVAERPPGEFYMR